MADLNDQDRFRISLYQNGVHSFRQGLQAYSRFANDGDPMQLKDAIMGIHHGVELLLKEMLVKHDEFLIFEDIRNVAKKKKQADQMGLGIFFIENPPRTVSFYEAVSRVEAFLKPPTLDQDLLGLLEDLNQKRNQLEHYAIDADIEEIDKLIAEIKDPLFRLFQSSFGDMPELAEKDVEDVWDQARTRTDRNRELRDAIKKVMSNFHGQEVSGKLFSTEGTVTLPTFESLQSDYRIPDWPIQRFDLYGTSPMVDWAVEVRARIGKGRSGDDLISNLANYSNLARAQLWLVVGVRASKPLREHAAESRVFLSDERDIEVLGRGVDPHRLL